LSKTCFSPGADEDPKILCRFLDLLATPFNERASHSFRLFNARACLEQPVLLLMKMCSGKSSIAGSITASNWQNYQHQRLKPRPVPFWANCLL
jgi:hypothetical protein